jgi:DNA polymerase-1
MPGYFAVVWDGGRDTRRTTVYPEYKRRRKELTEVERLEREKFFIQLEILKQTIFKFGLAQFEIRGREADDVLYSLVKQKSFADNNVVVISTDEDMFQLFLCHPNLTVYSPIKDQEYKVKDVEQKFGIPIAHFPMYKALVGDASDNLPGVKGIGPVGAKTYINAVCVSDSIKPKQQLIKERKLEEKIDRQGTELARMLELVRFLDIPDRELVEGKQVADLDLVNLYTNMTKVYDEYGFQMDAHFGVFAAPFDTYLQRRSQL